MAADPHNHPVGKALAASAIFVAMLFAAFSLWTAIPLSWIYIGSKVSKSQFPATGPYMVVAVGIILSIVITAWLLIRLNRLYVQITGTNRLEPMRPAWMRSVRDDAPVGTTTVVEAVLMGSVLLAAVAFVLWFFLLAGSPIPNQ
jgi:hypothetical protein